MRSALLASVVCLVSLAHAEEPGKQVASADARKCRNLIDEARNLAAAKKFPLAIAKLEACVALIPDEPIALGELGFTAFRANELDKAEKATRAAIASQASPNLRGAFLFNLGLILDARKDLAGAIAAYSDSLRARPHGVVRGKLRDLDPKAVEAFDPYKPVALPGPFKSVDAFCKSLPATEKTEFEETIRSPCACGTVAKTLKDAAPYKHVQVVRRTCATDGHHMGSFGHDDYHLAIEVDAGWFVGPITSLWFNRRCDNDTKFPVLAVKDVVPGGRPEVTLEMTNAGECRKVDAYSDRGLIVAGIGPSGAPSATPLIMLKRRQDVFTSDKDGNMTGELALNVDVALDATWTADGLLELKATKTNGLDKGSAGDLIGKHALPFP